MGDRATVIFTDDGETYSPGVYLHSHGSAVVDLVRMAASRLRKGDAGYSSARFAGHCHTVIQGNLSLGLVPQPPNGARKWTPAKWADWGPGDQGVWLVDLRGDGDTISVSRLDDPDVGVVRIAGVSR